MWLFGLIGSFFRKYFQPSPERIAAEFEALVERHGLKGQVWLHQKPFGMHIWWDIAPLVKRRGEKPAPGLLSPAFMRAVGDLAERHEKALNAKSVGWEAKVVARRGDPVTFKEAALIADQFPDRFGSRRGTIPVFPLETAS